MILLRSRAGLCNRLRALDSAILLGRKTGHRVSQWWERNNACSAQFSDLFEPVPGLVLQSGYADVATRMAFSPRGALAVARRVSRFDNWGSTLEGKLDSLFYPGRSPLDMAVITELSQKKVICIRSDDGWFYPENFTWLVPLPFIRDRISAVKRDLPGQSVGIHIRRGDHAAAIARNPTELFVEAIRARLEAAPDTSFFLATDDTNTRESIVSQFAGRIFSQPATGRRDTVAGVAEGVVDLFCLAGCSEIWGTRGSAFSETAHHLRKAPITYPADTRPDD